MLLTARFIFTLMSFGSAVGTASLIPLGFPRIVRLLPEPGTANRFHRRWVRQRKARRGVPSFGVFRHLRQILWGLLFLRIHGQPDVAPSRTRSRTPSKDPHCRARGETSTPTYLVAHRADGRTVAGTRGGSGGMGNAYHASNLRTGSSGRGDSHYERGGAYHPHLGVTSRAVIRFRSACLRLLDAGVRSKVALRGARFVMHRTCNRNAGVILKTALARMFSAAQPVDERRRRAGHVFSRSAGMVHRPVARCRWAAHPFLSQHAVNNCSNPDPLSATEMPRSSVEGAESPPPPAVSILNRSETPSRVPNHASLPEMAVEQLRLLAVHLGVRSCSRAGRAGG